MKINRSFPECRFISPAQPVEVKEAILIFFKVFDKKLTGLITITTKFSLSCDSFGFSQYFIPDDVITNLNLFRFSEQKKGKKCFIFWVLNNAAIHTGRLFWSSRDKWLLVEPIHSTSCERNYHSHQKRNPKNKNNRCSKIHPVTGELIRFTLYFILMLHLQPQVRNICLIFTDPVYLYIYLLIFPLHLPTHLLESVVSWWMTWRESVLIYNYANVHN